MLRLEDIQKDSVISGILPNNPVICMTVLWYGTNNLELIYKDASGNVGQALLSREDEARLSIESAGKPWSFGANGYDFKLAAEAYRISLAYLFDPHLAVHTSNVEPLPHQITAVYGEMLPRQPLRFLLADDPGAGKTIMAGLLIKELIARGDLERCLIVCPGSLVEQWQDEMYKRFHMDFDIITNERLESARSGNAFNDARLAIARLDKLSRNEDIHEKLKTTDWDLIIIDEAHKMSATVFGNEINYTKRYRLGELLSGITRNLLLLTATPHNGKENEFQVFLQLIDQDMFEGAQHSHGKTDASDIMRRMVKEDLLKFDGTPLFPERISYAVNYQLSDLEAQLYAEVTQYVREEFNRAEKLINKKKTSVIGFALTSLQRRLASSPEAIYQSIKRRKARLIDRQQEVEVLKRGLDAANGTDRYLDILEDSEDLPDVEEEELEDNLIDHATAAQSIEELKAEIKRLNCLEELASRVRASGEDKKWSELSTLLQDEKMLDMNGNRHKLVIFTEHRDTLNYLEGKIRSLLGRPEAVVTIHGGLQRDIRRQRQEAFTQDKDVLVLVATDAAGEGINLQRAHLMVNYDLPWNPNRIEQRFGRIHRIGQIEVCHLWNLIAYETREGEVFRRLFEKLEEERKALGGRVFDVLGRVSFDNRPLKDLLLEAIRYGDLPEVRERLHRVVEGALEQRSLIDLIEERALSRDTMDVSRVMAIREEMERIEARRLQPYFISSFFIAAFEKLGGTIYQREGRRWEITRVPSRVKDRARELHPGQPVLGKYERVCFDKSEISLEGKPVAEFVSPGHPLLDAVIDIMLEEHKSDLKKGTYLLDPNDYGTEPKYMALVEHAIKRSKPNKNGTDHIVSRRLQFVEIGKSGPRDGGSAPYLDYSEMGDGLLEKMKPAIESRLPKDDIEIAALNYAIVKLVKQHYDEVIDYRRKQADKAIAAVRSRLTKEIGHWDTRANDLAEKEKAGKSNSKLNSEKARQRANDLALRMNKRLDELEAEKSLITLPPVVYGGAIIVPQGLVNAVQEGKEVLPDHIEDTRTSELIAMNAVMAYERQLGNIPRDVSADKCGYDVESKDTSTGRLRFIEVKGRVEGAPSVTVTRNEIMRALNVPDEFMLAIVGIAQGQARSIHYVRSPFTRMPDFAEISVNYDMNKLITRAEIKVDLRG